VRFRAAAFVVAAWLLSRTLVAIGFAAVSHPHLGMVTNWDGLWYETIATTGYTYSANGGYSSVAFFPLYPLVVRVLMFGHIPFDVAAIVVSNVAFLATLWIVFGWIRERMGVVTARWTVAVLAFFPLSLFGSVAYSEAPFMLLSALALRDFDGARYGRAAVWTALASLARPAGLWLLPAFFVSAIIEKRKTAALLCAAAAATGVAIMGIYCGIRFGDPLAPLHAEAAWRRVDGSGLSQWGVLALRGTYSFEHWRFQLQLLFIAVAIVLLRRMPAWLTILLWAFVVYWEHWAWARDFPTAAIVLLGGFALWYFRKALGAAAVVFGFAAILSLVAGGAPVSVDRILYAVLPFSIALGCFFATFPYVGVPMVLAFAFDLVRLASAFARSQWTA
jgi:Gpi18-like mannosyltransferase